MGLKKVYHYLCIKILAEQKGYILIAYLKVWMNTKNISKNIFKNEQDSLKILFGIFMKVKLPDCTYPIEFSTLINLVTALNTPDINTINNFCLLYIKDDLSARRTKSIKKNY